MVFKNPLFSILLVTMTVTFVLGTSRHYVSIGRRQPHDLLIQEKRVDISGRLFKTPHKMVLLTGDKYHDITEIRIYKKGLFAVHPKSALYLGGPGYKFATIHLKGGAKSRGLHALIKVYGKPPVQMRWKKLFALY